MGHKDVQEVVGNRGPARSGATSAWFGKFRVRKGAPGCIRELSGSVSWSFRSVESNSRSPLSDSFGGTFDFKTGRSSAERKRFAEVLVLYCQDGAKLVCSGVGACGLWPGNPPTPAGRGSRRGGRWGRGFKVLGDIEV